MKRGLLLLLCACTGCNLLLVDNPKFEAHLGDEHPNPEPTQPEWLQVHTLGDPADVPLAGVDPGLLLAGGEPIDAGALLWLSERSGGGDVVILQDRGEPLLGTELYESVGGFDSVQTLILPSPSAANNPWVSWTIDHAEVVVLVGSDPRRLWWKGSALADALARAWERGTVIGGVGAGAAVLGQFVFTAEAGPLSSAEALADPYTPSLTLDREFVAMSPLAATIVEPEFGQTDRMGRLLSLAARVHEYGWTHDVLGLGIDGDASLTIDADGIGVVHGKGYVYLVYVDQPASVCLPDTPLELGPLQVTRLGSAHASYWPGGIGNGGEASEVSASDGATVPPNPY